MIAPLNWGLGHATRCIPIIRALEENNYTPIIASDGKALELLQKEFPHLQFLELPSYHIEYPKNGKYFKWKFLINSPKMLRAIVKEKQMVANWITKYNIVGIISDNRFGVFNKSVPSVYITHQIKVFTGCTTWLSSKLHQHSIKKFTECWIPDVEGVPNLAGELSHIENPGLQLKYIGPLSRMEKKDVPKKYDLLILLSGPEPQRGILEEKLKIEAQRFDGNVVFVKGIIEENQTVVQIDNVCYFNFMNSHQLEQTINESEFVLCRSGYTTIMDLAKMEKKAFLIPTPGQYEQEYLAKKLEKEGLIPYADQDRFRIEDLKRERSYVGLKSFKSTIDWKNLFRVFDPLNK